MTDDNEEYFWAVANNIYSLVQHREESDSWRESVIELLKAIYDAGYWEGRA